MNAPLPAETAESLLRMPLPASPMNEAHAVLHEASDERAVKARKQIAAFADHETRVEQGWRRTGSDMHVELGHEGRWTCCTERICARTLEAMRREGVL